MTSLSITFKLFALISAFCILNVSAAIKCKICDSTNEKCASDAANVEDQGCPEDAKVCYISTDKEGNISRGCAKEACTGSDCRSCTNEESKPACNTDTVFTCKTCDSSTDPNCAQWKDEKSIASSICPAGINKCLVQIKADKNTERRCATKDETCTADTKTCDLCETSNCNKGVYPTNRRLCYQCEAGSKCANPSDNPTEVLSLPCTLYDADEKCFMWGDSDTNMARGCSSSTSEYAKCQEKGTKCAQCSTDNCNVAKFKVTQSLKCIQCQKSDANCAWGYETSAAKDCVNSLEYWQPEGCYVNKIDGNSAERGCINDATNLQCESVSTCTSCNTQNGCNNADVMEYSCYKCRSDNNAACVNELKDDKDVSYAAEKCRNPVTQENQGCYTERWNGIIIRSCLVDADSQTRKQCADANYKNCELCKESNCNNKVLSGASSVTFTGGLLVLSWITLKFL